MGEGTATSRQLMRLVELLMVPMSAALLLGTLGAAVDHWHWTIALAAHFPVQYLAMAVLLCLVWPFMRPRRIWVALMLVSTVVLNATAVVPLFAARAPTTSEPGLRILSFNTWPHNARTAEIWEFVDAQQPDIALLFETSEALLASTATLADRYQVTTVGEFIVMISHDVDASIRTGTPIHQAVVLDVRHCGRALYLIAAHPYPALGRWDSDATTTFGQLENYCLRADSPVVIVGDLNTTLWGWRFRRLLERGRLVDSEIGYGLQPSFPLWPPLLSLLFGIPIDHCLHSAELLCTHRQLGPPLGSNHRPLLVEMAWAGG